MRECKIEENKTDCNCTYEPCPRKGLCCECVEYHRNYRELPACYFPADVEKTHNRSIEKFIEVYMRGKR